MSLVLLAYLAAAAGLILAGLAIRARALRRPVLLPVSVFYLLLSVPVFSITALSIYRSLSYSHMVAEPRFLAFAFCAYFLVAAVMARRSGQFIVLGVEGGDFSKALLAATGFSGAIPADGRVPCGEEGQFVSVHLHAGLQAAQAGLLPGPDPAAARDALLALAKELGGDTPRTRVWALSLLLPALMSLAAGFWVYRQNAAMDGMFWMQRALAFTNAKDYEAAVYAAEKAVARGGATEDRARGLLGHVLAARGDAEGAGEVFSDLLAREVRDPEALAYAARFYAGAARPPDPERAERLARRSLKRSSGCVPCREALAVALAASGRYEEAVRAQEELVGLLEAGGAGEVVLTPMKGRLDEYRRKSGEGS